MASRSRNSASSVAGRYQHSALIWVQAQTAVPISNSTDTSTGTSADNSTGTSTSTGPNTGNITTRTGTDMSQEDAVAAMIR